MNEPWNQPDALAWRIHADWLGEQPKVDRKRWLRALRFSLGLTKRPKMVLTCSIAGVRHVVMPREKDWCTGRTAFRWVTVNYAKSCPVDIIESGEQIRLDFAAMEGIFGATPLDFPGLADDATWHNVLLMSFYWRASYDIRLSFRDEKVWQRFISGDCGYHEVPIL